MTGRIRLGLRVEEGQMKVREDSYVVVGSYLAIGHFKSMNFMLSSFNI